MANDPVVADFRAEERRIRAAYARRPADSRDERVSAAHRFILQGVERELLSLLTDMRRMPLTGRRILEIGCGTGRYLRQFVSWGARPLDVVGMDLLPGRLDIARALSPAGGGLFCGSAGALALRDTSFDIVAQFTVFTSILDDLLRREVAREMLRVLNPGGLIIWYDFFVDNPSNPDVRGVGKREIQALFPGCEIDLHRVTLAPPIVRRVAPRSWALCSLLARIPFLRTHYLAAITRA